MYDTEDEEAYANTTRTIHRCDVEELPDGLIVIEFEGDGFLYRQVRNMVGALLVVASGKEKPEWIATLLAARDRRLAPTAASARGLFLANVEYPPEMLAHDENWDRFDDDP